MEFYYTFIGASKKYFLPVIASLFAATLLLLPTLIEVVFGLMNGLYINSARTMLVSLTLFLIPLVFFYRNIKVYFYILSVYVVLTPLFVIAFIWFKAKPNFSLVAFLLQTNTNELKEITSGILVPFLLISSLFLFSYLFAVRKISYTKIPFRFGALVSSLAVAFTVSYFFAKTYVKEHHIVEVLEEHYPICTISGLAQAYAYIKKNNLNESKDFHFNAYRKDTLSQRQIHVLIIGESSRYDRWELNGYDRPTSPLLKDRENLKVFSNVVAGSNLTWLSVPQMITRANPSDLDRQFTEKSILSAFRDAGFKTVWLSNQTDKDIFWSGTITLHAKTADFSVFSPTESPNFGSYAEQLYDERLLPLLDSVLMADKKDVFFVLHTMGNHWDYVKRYPESFDFFKPSGYTQAIDPYSKAGKEAVLNTYDNSIRYSDYLIDKVIETVKKEGAVASVTFLSDHGEDLYDVNPTKLDFHVKPSEATLHVPLFIWNSDGYQSLYKEKTRFLNKNRDQPIGTENIFYTLLDMANVSFIGFDSTKSISHPSFEANRQSYYDNNKQVSRRYTDLYSSYLAK